jgi:hypothetical protein
MVKKARHDTAVELLLTSHLHRQCKMVLKLSELEDLSQGAPQDHTATGN